VEEKTDEPPGIEPLPSVPAVFVAITTTVSPLVMLFAEKLMVEEASTSFERSSWMKLPTGISLVARGIIRKTKAVLIAPIGFSKQVRAGCGSAGRTSCSRAEG
jgi:hypothetical protein